MNSPKPLKRLYCLLTVVCLFIAMHFLSIENPKTDTPYTIGLIATLLSFMFGVLFSIQANKK